jgi:hypothetical protein
MKRKQATTLLVALFLGSGLIGAQAEEKKAEPKKQITCPVMGGKINKAQYVDVKGYRIYVCCPGCKDKIKADPDKYIKQLEAEGITPDKAEKKKMKAEDHSGHNH